MVILVTLRERARHGYEISKELERLSKGRLVMLAGTLYPILHKLERKELICSAWETGADERPRREVVHEGVEGCFVEGVQRGQLQVAGGRTGMAG